MAAIGPDAVVEIVRRELGQARYREVLRHLFRVRRDDDTGRTWTSTHELVTRCAFAGVVTTNYDPGILDARMAVRPAASSTGFASWTSDDALDRWRTADVYGDGELPVLYAHGQHNEPDDIVLATNDYRRAYAGKLRRVMERLFDQDHLVWIGFSFADRQISAILGEMVAGSGPPRSPGAPPRHVAILPWDGALDPDVVRKVMEIQHGCQVVLYPAHGGDHSALDVLLADLADPRFPAPVWLSPATPAEPAVAEVAVRWVHGGQPVEPFVGRAAELARLDRWAADPEVRLVGVTAWGGAGKTALVTEWLVNAGGLHRRPVRGLFAWNFYENSSAEEWADTLVAWAEESFGQRMSAGPPAARVRAVARAVPLLLVLDGLEVAQEGPGGAEFGRLLDGVLREALTGLCQTGDGLVVLTSRFPFADLARFYGTAVRTLDVPPFTPDEGADLLARAGAAWLPDGERHDLVRAVDGHALAVGVLAAVLADRPPTTDVAALREELIAAARTDDRVRKVLAFYAERLAKPDRMLVAIVALFPRPVPAATVLALGRHERLGAPLAGWTDGRVRDSCAKLAGLLTWHPDGTISSHPLVRDTFRPLALVNAATLASDVTLADLPTGRVRTRDEALRVVEMIELLLDAGKWAAADEIFRSRTHNGGIFKLLPAARLGRRCAAAFAGTPEREETCRTTLSERRRTFYLNEIGLFALNSGDAAIALRFLQSAAELSRAAGDVGNLGIGLGNLARCLVAIGQPGQASEAASEELDLTVTEGDSWPISIGHSDLGNAYDVRGDTAAAERAFLDADRSYRAEYVGHMTSLAGTWWGDVMARTGRRTAARRLTDENRVVSEINSSNADVARCDRLIGRCDLVDGDVVAAGRRFEAAMATFREGDVIVELADTLPDLAEQRRRVGKLDEAERLCGEAIALAGPRELVPSHARALAVRAKVRGDQGRIEQGRDDAEDARRLATVTRRLPWQELDALEAHAYLDTLEQTDRVWRAQADELRARLVPPGLDPDPLATIEAEEAE